MASHAEPLLDDQARQSLDIELPELSHQGHIRGRDGHPKATRSQTPSPWLIALALCTTVVGLTINTEATAYFEVVLGWKKPFATFYITHSALALPWFCHVAYLRYQARKQPYSQFVKSYNNQLRASISGIDAYATNGPWMIFKFRGHVGGPLDFLATTMAIITVILTVSGLSWFMALSFTTPSDLTAIYNCSTFFAAVFSVPLLKEKLGLYSIIAVGLSIVGTFVIAYGDTTADHADEDKVGSSRFLGNVVACAGAVAFGLYEVLMKKWVSSSQPMSASSSLPLTLAASALTGIYTFFTLWVGLVVLHLFRIETFVWPSAHVAMWIAISVLTGSLSITLLVVLVIWTGPIFGSMANVLTVFSVAMADWIVFGLEPSLATYVGGMVIVIAFALLTWDVFREQKP
nr:hypothetical protein CFP56_43899 [Quercus suber]